jgi:ankyrin repeat protein
MHYAAQSGSQAAAGYLALHGVAVDSRDVFGFTPLMFACRTGNLDLVQFFLTNGANRRAIYASKGFGRTMFHFACESNSPDVARLFFSHARLEAQTAEGTALVIAARRGNVQTVSYLLECGANVNAFDSFHQTALMVAASGGFLEVVSALVEAGANVTIKDRLGQTALVLAIKTGNAECALVLAKIPDALRGAVCPLLLAAKTGNAALVNFFVTEEIGLNDVDSDGVFLTFSEDSTSRACRERHK